MTGVRVINQLGRRVGTRIGQAHPQVDVLNVKPDAAVPEGLAAEVLATPHRSANAAAVAEMGGVRWVHVFSTGVDGVDPKLYEGRVVTCSRGASAVPISEYTLAVMLAFEKDLPGIWLSEPAETWNWAQLGGLSGRTLALVGLGGIGVAVATRALAFGMDVVALRRRPEPSPVPGVHLAASLEEVVEVADHLVLALPATPRTRHLLDAAALTRVKPGVHLVNVSRGTLVDQEALRTALDDGRVARASLDTVDPEPLPAGHWMYSHPQVRLSAHVSWSSPGALEVMSEMFVENLARFLDDRTLVGVVDPVEGY